MSQMVNWIYVLCERYFMRKIVSLVLINGKIGENGILKVWFRFGRVCCSMIMLMLVIMNVNSVLMLISLVILLSEKKVAMIEIRIVNVAVRCVGV